MPSVSAFEVRCPRCDVSFPVGTKKCMHCGGPTREAAATQSEHESLEDLLRESADPYGITASSSSARTSSEQLPSSSRSRLPSGSDDFRTRGASSTPIEATSESIFSSRSDDGSIADADEVAESGSPSVARALFQSLGGMIWVILLIAISLARTCGGE